MATAAHASGEYGVIGGMRGGGLLHHTSSAGLAGSSGSASGGAAGGASGGAAGAHVGRHLPWPLPLPLSLPPPQPSPLPLQWDCRLCGQRHTMSLCCQPDHTLQDRMVSKWHGGWLCAVSRNYFFGPAQLEGSKQQEQQQELYREQV